MAGEMDLRALNAGRLRHPLYGNRSHWYPQRIAPGFVDKAIERGTRDVREEMLRALDRVIAAFPR